MDAASFGPEQALAFLRERNVDLQNFASDPRAFDRTCSLAYKALPLPLRLALGKDRVRSVLEKARDRYLASASPAGSSP